jgi:hypothetical protein
MRQVVAVKMLTCVMLAGAAASPALSQDAEQQFYRAYYLETAQGDLASANKLYGEIVRDRRAGEKVRGQAKSRRDGVQEELASTDFAQLMPPGALAYIEVNRPGGQLESLLDQLGLLRNGDITEINNQRAGVSPALVRSLLGMRGLAAAVTGFDPAAQKPTGVAVFHPGSLDVIRGLIETALPAGGDPVDPIGGYPTYNIEGEVFVTLTNKLVIISPQEHEIAGVINRMQDADAESLATADHMSDILAQRGDGLLFFAVNFEPILPLLQGAMAAASAQDEEVAMAMKMFDPKSLRSLVGQLGVGDDGLFMDLTLKLDERHQNLAFNLMRMPPIDRETLARVPAGAAGFFAMALNERTNAKSSDGRVGDQSPAISLMDFGREVFGNIVGVTAFVMASDDAGAARNQSDEDIPDAALVLSVNDPAKSHAMWSMMLGIASAATGGANGGGETLKIGGAQAWRYPIEDELELYLATAGNEIIFSPSRVAIEAALATQQGGKSVLEDKAFAPALARLGDDATIALFGHPARCMEVATQFASPRELEEMAPIMELMQDTVGSVVVTHSPSMFQFSATVTGIPKIGGFLSELIERERGDHKRRREYSSAVRHNDWDRAIELVDQRAGDHADAPDLLWKKFRLLATGKRDHQAAAAVGAALFETIRDDATQLNNHAWAMLTEDDFDAAYGPLALKFAARCNELTDHENWMFVDTLALARFVTGDADAAIELEKRALELVGDNSGRNDVLAALRRFESERERTVQRDPL